MSELSDEHDAFAVGADQLRAAKFIPNGRGYVRFLDTFGGLWRHLENRGRDAENCREQRQHRFRYGALSRRPFSKHTRIKAQQTGACPSIQSSGIKYKL